jgi:hypothetical protein
MFTLHNFTNIRHFIANLRLSINLRLDPHVQLLRDSRWNLVTFESTISIEDCDGDNLHIFLEGIEPESEQWLDVLSSPCFKSLVEISLDIFWDQFLEGGVDTEPTEMEGLYEDRCIWRQ